MLLACWFVDSNAEKISSGLEAVVWCSGFGDKFIINSARKDYDSAADRAEARMAREAIADDVTFLRNLVSVALLDAVVVFE